MMSLNDITTELCVLIECVSLNYIQTELCSTERAEQKVI